MGLFVDLDINTDPALMVDAAIDSLTAYFAGIGVPDWQPSDADLVVILFQVAAVLNVDVASVAAQVGGPVFRAYGTKLAGIPYISGATATVSSTWTANDALAHTISAGTYVTIAGAGFYVQADAPFSGGSVSGVTLVASDVGVAYNGLTGPVELLNGIDWLPTSGAVTVIGETGGGADPETDDDYQNRLAGLLQLQAPRPITATDYSTFVLSFQPEAGTDQEEVGRATAIDGYDPIATGTFTGTLTSGSATLTSVTGAANVGPGSVLSGTSIPGGTTVLSNSGTSILMSANASGAHSGETVTATGIYNQPRTEAVFVAQADGTTVTTDTLTAAQAWLRTYREVGFLVYVLPPTYTTIYVTFQIKCYATADSTGTVAAAQAALLAYLSPSGFGQGGSTTPTWINDPVVRINKLIGIVEAVAGVDYCPSLTLGTSASPGGTTDVAVFGPAALIQSDDTTILGSAV